jgi:hypothetical protein
MSVPDRLVVTTGGLFRGDRMPLGYYLAHPEYGRQPDAGKDDPEAQVQRLEAGAGAAGAVVVGETAEAVVAPESAPQTDGSTPRQPGALQGGGYYDGPLGNTPGGEFPSGPQGL